MTTAVRPTVVAVALIATALAGCRSPSKANIELRKQNAALRDDVASLKLAHEDDLAAIKQLESRATTVPVLPHERLSTLFTAHGLKLGKLTGGWDADRETPGDEGLQIFVVPTDQDGDELKAAGSFVVEAFDLTKSGETRLGRWEVSSEQAAKKWLGNALQYGYIIELPWQEAPTGDEVTVRVTFTDELTGRAFDAQRVVQIDPPRAVTTAPVTRLN
ncbi:MAG: hypothetical protein WBD40_02560 [Tepidisphaeraceae bacterium]